MLLAIDPGKKVFGWALFTGESRRLLGCGMVRSTHPHARDRGRCLAEDVLSAVAQIPSSDVRIRFEGLDLVIERMRWRPNDASSQPNDLLDVSETATYFAQQIARRTEFGWLKLVPAAEWKANLSKAIHHARIAKVLDLGEGVVLSAGVLNVPKTHHKEVLDAVGIGLHALGRTDKAGRLLGAIR